MVNGAVMFGFVTYLGGRGSVKLVLATLSVVLTLAVGWWFVGVRWDWTAVRWLIAGLTSIAVIALIYHNAVPRTQPWHSVLPGATLATAVWFGATALFGWYLQRYADYSIIYGSLGVGIALLVWMYMISLIILVGAEFNAMLYPRAMLGRELREMSGSTQSTP